MKPPYKITEKIVALVASISEKIGEINATHLYKPATELRKKNRIKTIQSSLEIEGNTLTEEQITALLENKRVLAPQKDILEVQNAIKVYEQLNTFNPFQLKDLEKAHAVLMNGLIDNAGKLRTTNVGIVKGSKVEHIAPSGTMVNGLMKDLFKYLKKGNDLILIKSCVFHYEFEFIHPFADGNGRMGRLWQTLILSGWNSIFANIPVESLIYQNQKAYYEALQASTDRTDSAPFIEFILQMILDAILDSTQSDQDTAQASDHVTAQAGIHIHKELSDQVQRLISALGQDDYTLAELMQFVGLTHRATFQKNYLNPAIEAGLIERMIPDKPKSPKQKYRKTSK